MRASAASPDMPFQPSALSTVPTDWARMDAAVDELLGLDPAEWPAAIERLAQGDAGLADELHHLLAAALEGHRQYGLPPPADGEREGRRPGWRDLDRETLAMAAQLRAGDDLHPAAAPARPQPAAAPRQAARGPRDDRRASRWRAAVAVGAGLLGALLVHWLHG